MKFTKTMLEGQEDTIQTQIKDYHKQFDKRIDSLEMELFGEEEVKGIKRGNPTLMGDFWTARGYIRSSTGAIKGTAQIAMDKAKERASKFTSMANDFFNEDWDNYRTLVEGMKPPVFKKLDEIRE